MRLGPNPSRINTCERCPIISPVTTFRMNTCKSVSKQRTLTIFRMNTYEKPGGEGATRDHLPKEKAVRRDRLLGTKKCKTTNKKPRLSFCCLYSIERDCQARLIPVPRILVQHTLADGHIDCRKRRFQQSPGRVSVARANSRAQLLDQRAHARPVGPVHFRALTRLRRPLQNGLLLLLYFGSLSLGHLLLLMGSSQTSNGKRGLPLCQTTRRAFPPRKPSRSRLAPLPL